MVRALAFSYNHKLKVLTTISAIKFGLAVSNSIDAYSLSCAHCAASAKNIFILRKGYPKEFFLSALVCFYVKKVIGIWMPIKGLV
jgi:hypothetical protein